MTATTRPRPVSGEGEAAAGAAAPKKSKKKLVIIATVVVLLAGGFIAKKEFFKPHYKPGQTVPLGKIDTLGQLTVNTSDGHLVQVTIALQLTEVADSKKVSADTPRFEDAATTILGSQTYNGLLSPAGRASAKAEILQHCQQIAGLVDGAAQQITTVYFTGFILQ